MSDSGQFDRGSIETFTSSPVESWIPTLESDHAAKETRWRRKSLIIAILLFMLTLLSTLVVGAEYAFAYAAGKSPSFDQLFSTYGTLLGHPALLMTGIPFAFTLVGILL